MMLSAEFFIFLLVLPLLSPVHGQRDGSVRLVGGIDDSQGRVEVYADNQWGTVCDDYWSSYSINAQVVCNQLGYTDLAASAYRCCAGFGYGSLPILLDDVKCTGVEDNLVECPNKGVGSHNCGHSEDVGVSCLCAVVPECAIPEENCPYFRTEVLSVPHRVCPICRCASCPVQPKCPTNCKSGQTMYYEGETCRRCKCRPQELPKFIKEHNDISLSMVVAAAIIMVVIPGIALTIACIIQRKREKEQQAKAKAAKEKEKAKAQAPVDWFAEPDGGQVMF